MGIDFFGGECVRGAFVACAFNEVVGTGWVAVLAFDDKVGEFVHVAACLEDLLRGDARAGNFCHGDGIEVAEDVTPEVFEALFHGLSKRSVVVESCGASVHFVAWPEESAALCQVHHCVGLVHGRATQELLFKVVRVAWLLIVVLVAPSWCFAGFRMQSLFRYPCRFFLWHTLRLKMKHP